MLVASDIGHVAHVHLEPLQLKASEVECFSVSRVSS